MSYYEKLSKVNIAEAVQAMGFKMDFDGRVRIPYHLDLQTPWIEQGICKDRNCFLWKGIMFDNFKVIHPGCMSCWKIFYIPKNLKDLFDVYEIQKSQSFASIVPSCKCGIETRNYTGRLGGYGAFWYNPLGCGLEKARENTAKLSEIYKRKLRLKRGCTEMEQFTITRLGLDSSRWEELLDIARQKLEIIEATFDINPLERSVKRPLSLRLKTEKWWIEWAADHGDMTYLEFVDKPFIPSLRMYENSIDRGKEIDDGYLWNYYKKHGLRKDIDDKCSRGTEETLIATLEDED